MPTEPNSDQERKLIELAYLGEWMINAHHDPEHQDELAQATLQSLLAQAKVPGGIGRDIETSDYYLDETWVERLYEAHIADYDDHIFWDELTERLAARDLARSRGIASDQINRDDDLAALKPLEDLYRQELERHGIDHLDLADGAS